jgi:CheY-like chemotaxis protein
LFVDDEENHPSALERELRPPGPRSSHIAIETALSAQAALDILRDNSEYIHVVVSDLRMPVMKGKRPAREIRDKGPEGRDHAPFRISEVEEIMKAVKAEPSATCSSRGTPTT